MPKKRRHEDPDWREGTDPIQRWLRVVTTVVVLGVFVYLTLGERPSDSVLVIALALGAVLLLLGYEGVVRLPFIDGGRDHDDDQED